VLGAWRAWRIARLLPPAHAKIRAPARRQVVFAVGFARQRSHTRFGWPAERTAGMHE